MVFKTLYKKLASNLLGSIDTNLVNNMLKDAVLKLDDSTIDIFVDKILSSVISAANTEDFQKSILAVTDPLFDRYKQLTLNTIGGYLKGTVQASEETNTPEILKNLPIPARYKRLMTNPLVQMLISNIGGGMNNPNNQTNRKALTDKSKMSEST